MSPKCRDTFRDYIKEDAEYIKLSLVAWGGKLVREESMHMDDDDDLQPIYNLCTVHNKIKKCLE